MNANTSTDRGIRSMNKAKSLRSIANYRTLLTTATPEEVVVLEKMIKSNQEMVDACNWMTDAGY